MTYGKNIPIKFFSYQWGFFSMGANTPDPIHIYNNRGKVSKSP